MKGGGSSSSKAAIISITWEKILKEYVDSCLSKMTDPIWYAGHNEKYNLFRALIILDYRMNPEIVDVMKTIWVGSEAYKLLKLSEGPQYDLIFTPRTRESIMQKAIGEILSLDDIISLKLVDKIIVREKSDIEKT